MWEFGSSVVWAAAVYLVVVQVVRLLRQVRWPSFSFQPVLRVEVGRSQPNEALPESLPELPFTLRQFISLESEEWMREDLTKRAHVLYHKHRDWPTVEQALMKEVNGWVAEPSEDRAS